MEEKYKEMGRKAFNPNKNPSLECPWALWPHTQIMVELWKTGWYDAQQEWILKNKKQKVKITETIYLLFDIVEDGSIKFNKGTVDKSIAMRTFLDCGTVFIVDSCGIKMVIDEKDL